jgi:hypothetical protein
LGEQTSQGAIQYATEFTAAAARVLQTLADRLAAKSSAASRSAQSAPRGFTGGNSDLACKRCVDNGIL